MAGIGLRSPRRDPPPGKGPNSVLWCFWRSIDVMGFSTPHSLFRGRDRGQRSPPSAGLAQPSDSRTDNPAPCSRASAADRTRSTYGFARASSVSMSSTPKRASSSQAIWSTAGSATRRRAVSTTTRSAASRPRRAATSSSRGSSAITTVTGRWKRASPADFSLLCAPTSLDPRVQPRSSAGPAAVALGSVRGSRPRVSPSLPRGCVRTTPNAARKGAAAAMASRRARTSSGLGGATRPSGSADTSPTNAPIAATTPASPSFGRSPRVASSLRPSAGPPPGQPSGDDRRGSFGRSTRPSGGRRWTATVAGPIRSAAHSRRSRHRG